VLTPPATKGNITFSNAIDSKAMDSDAFVSQFVLKRG